MLGQEVWGNVWSWSLEAAGWEQGKRNGEVASRGVWGCLRISDFFLRTMGPHVQWQTLNQEETRGIRRAQREIATRSLLSYCKIGLLCQVVSFLEWNAFANSDGIKQKKKEKRIILNLGIDWKQNMQLSRFEKLLYHLFRSWWKFPEGNMCWSWLWLAKAACTDLCKCKRNSENSRRKHNEATNWDQGTPSDSHLSLNIQSMGKLLSLFFSSRGESWIVVW